MIGLCLLLGSILSDFPEWDGEFDKYEESFGDPIDREDEIYFPEIIAEQENRAALLDYVENHEVETPYIPDFEIEELLAPLIDQESTVVDYGMGLAYFLSKQAGKVYAFERDPQVFSERYWQLTRDRAQNVLLYCTILQEMDRTLDEYEIRDVSLICVHCGGREDLFLKGANFTIEKYKPALLIHLIGGLTFEQGDRFVKEEFDRRIEEIAKKGYSVRRIRGDLYLALPL